MKKKDEIASKSAEVLQKIMTDSRLGPYVPIDKIPSVFVETDDVTRICLIVIGQDPTVKDNASRETITDALVAIAR